MRKFILPILCLLVAIPAVVHGKTLYSTLLSELGYFPNIEERAPLYLACGYTDEYYGGFDQNINLNQCIAPVEYLEELCDGIPCNELLGGNQSRRPTEFKSSLDENKLEGHSDTTIRLTTITTKDGNTLSGDILGSRIVLSINPGRSNAETVVCTGLTVSTKTFTGCTFGFRFDDPLATQASNIKPHSPGEPVIISNTDTFNVDNFISRTGTQIITATNTWNGIQTYGVHPEASSSLGIATTSKQYVTKELLDATSISGGVSSTESVIGQSELATRVEMASSTPFDVNNPHVIQSQYATSTCEFTGLNAVITENDGKISTGCIDQSSAYTWTATSTFATTTMDEATITSSTISELTSQVVTSTVVDAGTLCLGGANCVTSIPSGNFVSSSQQTITVTGSTEINIISKSIAGGILGTDECIVLEAYITDYANSNPVTWTMDLNYGATTLATISSVDVYTATVNHRVKGIICGAGTTSAQFGTLEMMSIDDDTFPTDGSVGGYFEVVFGTSAIDSTTAQNFQLTTDWSATTGSPTITFRNAYIYKITR